MTLHLWLADLAAYSAQIGVLIVAGAALPWLLRLQRPDAMLLYRQALLAACLLLPWAQRWTRPQIDSPGEVSVRSVSVDNLQDPGSRRITLEQAAALLLAAGLAVRMGWLLAGLHRLRQRRREARAPDRLPPFYETLAARIGVSPAILVSPAVSSPVTFGTRNPVILLPERFFTMPTAAQEAIACHELVHIRRRDWPFTMAEESIRALFWFHPAVWWLLGKIQLTREQAVDSEVIALAASREQYIGALLAVAEGGLRPDLAPAPLFLRKSHLAQRVALLLKEVTMSRKRLLSSLAAISGALLLTARLAVLHFPISAPAQEVVQGGANLAHRAPIEYPADAIEKGIQGTVIVEATLNERGVVSDARVLSGPELLRKAALKSVLEWHYAAQAQSPVQVAIDFKLPARTLPALGSGPSGKPGVIRQIRFPGVPAAVRQNILSRLSIQVGDSFDPASLSTLRPSLREVDEHLEITSQPFDNSAANGYALTIFYTVTVEESSQAVPRLRVGGNAQSEKVLKKAPPVYPPQAKLDRIQGVVRLNVIVNKDGTVQDVQVISGDPLLAESAVDAVRQWTYRTTLLNGNPVEVATVVDVNYTLKD